MKNIARVSLILVCFSVLDNFLELKTVIANSHFHLLNSENGPLSDDDDNKASTILDFKASYNGSYTLLEWRLENYSKDDRFVVEVSRDEENYESLAEVNNFKSLHDSKYYTFIDNDNLLKDSFYRLRQTSSDGTIVYSRVAMVKVNPLNQLRLFPVPIKNVLNIKGYFGEVADIEISVSDLNGTNYPVYNLIKVAEDHYTLDFSSFRSNNYFINIKSGGKSASFRVLKL